MSYPLGYFCSVVRILKTQTYEAWFANCVTSKPAPESTFGLHDCPWEIPAMYYKQRGDVVALLLRGGDKRSQKADITLALKIADNWK
jgi:hypothetical protein